VKLKANWANKVLVLVDEMSLISCEMLHIIDSRLRIAFNSELAFGGVHIVFFGDLFQLPPVSGTSLYTPLETEAYQIVVRKKKTASAVSGRRAWLGTTAFYELDINYRQESGETELIDMLRTGRCGQAPSMAQMEPINKKLVTMEQAMSVTGPGALWLTTTNKDRRGLNDAMLRQLRADGKPTIHVFAQHFRTNTRGGTVQQGVSPILSASERSNKLRKHTGQEKGGKVAICQSLLRLAIGARVVLTMNDPEYADLGMVNGAMGTLIALEYPQGDVISPGLSFKQVVQGGAPSLPVAIVQFDNFKSSRSCEITHPRVVPVFPISTTVDASHRFQLPLRLARARTVHSAQGITCDEMVFAPTNPDDWIFAYGLAYVACSRVRTLAGSWLLNQRLEGRHFSANNKCVQYIDAEYNRLRSLDCTMLGLDG